LRIVTFGDYQLTYEELDDEIKDVCNQEEILNRLSSSISSVDLRKVLNFVKQNKELFAAGTLGTESSLRSKIKASKSNLPFDLEYEPKKGDIVVKLGELGKGSYKVVKKRLVIPSLQLEAVGSQDTKYSVTEKKFMKAAKGISHVVQMHTISSYFSRKKNEYRSKMVLPLYNMGELKFHMGKKTLSDLNKFQIASDVTNGLIGLHGKKIIHRDIKPENIFLEKVVEDGKEVIHGVVGDLGLACFSDKDNERFNNAGTPFYMPPEALEKKTPDEKVDAWSLGITLSELFTGKSPVSQAKTMDGLKMLANGLENFPEPADRSSIDYVIWKLLRPKKEDRMTVNEAQPFIDKLLKAEKERVV
jgi:serine/threonine protein kinase